MATAPTLWLNGQQITGLAGDVAPVLGNVSLTWGTDSLVEHQGPASLGFSVLFLGGIHDMPGLKRGAEIELLQGSVSVFAGRIRSAQATSGAVAGSMRISCTATDYLADLEGTFTSTDWAAQSSSSGRWATLKGMFTDQGWTLTPSALNHGYNEAESKYQSIKCLTVLDRYISHHARYTRWDASKRVGGVLQKRIAVGYRGELLSANTLGYEPDATWKVNYPTPGNSVLLDAGQIHLGVEWKQSPDSAISAVQLSEQITRVDEESGKRITSTEETNHSDSSLVSEFGSQSVEVATSATKLTGDTTVPSNWRRQIATTWMRPDAGWEMGSIEIHEVTEAVEKVLLNSETRSQCSVIVGRILTQMPHQGPSSARGSLLGGDYTWTGEAWEITLNIGRFTRSVVPATQWTFQDVGIATQSQIRNATAETVGSNITFADFQQISRN